MIQKRPGTLRGEYAQAGLAYIMMRHGDMAAAASHFRTLVEPDRAAILADYAKIMAAACDSLAGLDSVVNLDEKPPPGSEVGYCILAARNGERDRALAVRWKVSLSARLIFGERRFRHERRMMALLHAAIRGGETELSPKQRKQMVAEYPGEFDYVADHWPEMRRLIDTASLYQPELSQARVRR